MPDHSSLALAPHRLLTAVLASLREHWRPLVAYHLFFTLLAATLLLPASAAALAALLKRIGRPVFTNAQLLDIALSPAGLLWLLAAIGLAFLVLALQQAGMILVTVRPGASRYHAALDALWTVARRFFGIASLTLTQVGAQLLLAVPLLLILVALYQWLLGGMESYYVLRVKPREWWLFLASALPWVLLWLWLAARLYLRWSLASTALILENASVRRALARSHELTHGLKRRLAVPVTIPVVVLIVLPVVVTSLFDWLITPLLSWLPERSSVLIPAMLVYLTTYGLLTLAATFVGVAINSLLIGCLYLRLAHRQPRPQAPPRGSHPGWVAWGAEAIVLALAFSQAATVLTSFEIRDRVEITAHRGSSMKAPENTLAAIEQAITDGADYVELDVRLTQDRQVVVAHDNSLRRLTSLDRSLSEMTLEEARQVDVGSWFGDAYTDERIPTLDEVIDMARGRIKFYIELKPARGDEEALASAVIDHLASLPENEVILASLSPTALREAKRLAPRLRTTLFAQFVVRGGMDRRLFNALGLRHNRVTPDSVRAAQRHGYQLHAWTVNGQAEMSRLIDLGVDNIITDRPNLLAEVLEERATLSDGELLLVKLRNWLHS
ncbi:glycerophosphoryl diester phosphodiesterase [Modicisalibacter ilicicola DSM 19980]|uniref:Glycerophosphoryl diester phosphodiesterase n=1 Tax=Modicisalibacter ilicicola DSM 19980 TaxID=1121942 RepID=A0A1M4Z3V6_9GAMM|nr:glycerophosphodiester phosphodiesterase family protein [Halomonas ilicicola]SHF12638.1 glycerophosphoryl diester phosphodiesterase [Halomonas ilicicola DSM 19980]